MNALNNNFNVSDNLTSQSFFGLFELDSTGKVLYSKVESDGIFDNRKTTLTGLNFYDEVITFKNVNEFRRHLDYFASGNDSVENFKFTCRFDDGSQEVKVRLVRISEREYDGTAKLTIVDIRKV
jgi:hypothetical protein